MSAGPVLQIHFREASVSCNLILSHQMESSSFGDFSFILARKGSSSAIHLHLYCILCWEQICKHTATFVLYFALGTNLQAYSYICIVFCVGNKFYKRISIFVLMKEEK